MKKILYFIGLIIIISFNSCTTSKVITEQNITAQSAYNSSDYQTAFTEWEKNITSLETRGKKADFTVYSGAGKSAMALNNYDKARKYLELASYTETVDVITLDSLALVYKYIDNLSKEINTLESIVSKHETYENIQDVNIRLLDAYVRSENWETGYQFWDKTLSPTMDVEILSNYFKLLVGLEKEDEIKKSAKEILLLDKNNITVLEYYANTFYDKAKERYQREIKAYEKKKTNKQYNHLLKELKIASADYRKSRDYFEKLYKLDANPEYARYLGNIYSKLKNKEKADYFKKLAEGSR